MYHHIHYTYRRFVVVFSVFLMLGSGGCAYQLGHLENPQAGFNFIPQDMEIAMGWEAANEVETEEEILNNAQLQQYVSELGQRLVQYSRRPDIGYEFKVIASDEINAFALPGGFIYVNSALIEDADNEAELAGVLAHEIGHVVARHGAKRMSKMIALQLGFALFWGLSDQDREDEWKLLLADAIATGFLLKNSRDDERQADDLGTETLYRAGYDPIALAHFFDKLRQEHDPSSIETFLSTHPSPGERMNNVQALIATFPPNPSAMTDTAQFQEVKSIVSGKAPSSQPALLGQGMPQQKWQPRPAEPINNEVGAPRRQ
ncbi:peptidase lipoprotein, M48 family [Candidatus Moduliflexus flocculans]|uniref:Peptidase lipoprotein, M48 family n=1 Tax=Candidatus Moduliflexus flocculans TaxID=1499966 RepID=A0A0S6VTZ1_9BACT|nr:peptidase lipoprotein, M48 family [Candidatus Moduliflexus flocculans]